MNEQSNYARWVYSTFKIDLLYIIQSNVCKFFQGSAYLYSRRYIYINSMKTT